MATPPTSPRKRRRTKSTLDGFTPGAAYILDAGSKGSSHITTPVPSPERPNRKKWTSPTKFQPSQGVIVAEDMEVNWRDKRGKTQQIFLAPAERVARSTLGPENPTDNGQPKADRLEESNSAPPPKKVNNTKVHCYFPVSFERGS